MPVSVAAVAASTSSGQQSIDLTALGIVGNIALVEVEATRATSVGTVITTTQLSYGAWDKTRVRSCVFASEDAVLMTATPNQVVHRGSTTKLLRLLSANGTAIDGECEPVSVSASALVIDWTNPPGTGIQLQITITWGENWQAYVNHYDGATSFDTGNASDSARNLDVTSVGFRPRAVKFRSVREAPSNNSTDGVFMAGFVALNEDGTVQAQAGSSYFEPDQAQAITIVGQVVKDDSVLQRFILDPLTAVLTQQCEHKITAGLSNGFTVKTVGTSGFALSGIYVALRNKNARFWVGVPTLGINTTGGKTVTPSFPPGAIWSIPTMVAVGDLNNYARRHAGFGSGVSCLDASIKAAAVSVENNAATSDTYCIQSSQLGVGLNVTGTADWAAAVSARGATTFTFNVTNAAAVDVLTIFLVVENLVEGTSDLAAASSSIDSTGQVKVSGAADLASIAPAIDAVGSLRVSGTSDLSSAAPAIDAVGQVRVSGSADLAAASAALDAVGQLRVSGVADLFAAAAAIDAVAAAIIAGEAALAAAAGELDADGSVGANTLTGSSSLAVEAPSVAAVGQVRVSGSATLEVESASLTTSGALRVSGTADLAAAAAALDAAGALRVSGVADLFAPSAALEAAGVLRVTGSAALAAAAASLFATDTALLVARACFPASHERHPFRPASHDRRIAQDASHDRRAEFPASLEGCDD